MRSVVFAILYHVLHICCSVHSFSFGRRHIASLVRSFTMRERCVRACEWVSVCVCFERYLFICVQFGTLLVADEAPGISATTSDNIHMNFIVLHGLRLISPRHSSIFISAHFSECSDLGYFVILCGIARARVLCPFDINNQKDVSCTQWTTERSVFLGTGGARGKINNNNSISFHRIASTELDGWKRMNGMDGCRWQPEVVFLWLLEIICRSQCD